MIKINCLSEEVLKKMKKTFDFDAHSPIEAITKEKYYNGDCDVLINDKALIIYARNEVTIYYEGTVFRMSLFDFLRIEIE